VRPNLDEMAILPRLKVLRAWPETSNGGVTWSKRASGSANEMKIKSVERRSREPRLHVVIRETPRDAPGPSRGRSLLDVDAAKD